MARAAVTHKWKGGEIFAQIESNARDSVRRAAFILQTEIKLQLSRSTSPSSPGQPPGAVSGALRRSVQTDLSELRSKLLARVGPGMVYSAIQEFGGTIKPVKAKALAVPIGKKGREVVIPPGGLRSLNLTFVKRKSGKPPVLLDQDGDVVFVLLSSVTLPPRPYVRPALKKVRRRILRLFTSAVLLRGLR